MTTVSPTVATAPRDLEGLKELGRFGLRTLAMELGMFEDASYKVAFQGMGAPEQAAAILAQLLEKDGVKPKAGKAAAAGKAATPPRTPVTTKEPKAAATGKGQADSAGDTGGNASKVLELLTEIKDTHAETLSEIQALREELQAVQYNVSGTNKLVTLGISLALQMSENVLSAPAKVALEAAIEQMEEITPQLQELIAEALGAAPDADEGNEE